MTTTDATLQPKTSDFNGHKAVSFGPKTGLVIKDAKSLQWSTDDFAFFTVARYTGVNDPLCGDLYLKGVQILVTPTSDVDGGKQAISSWARVRAAAFKPRRPTATA